MQEGVREVDIRNKIFKKKKDLKGSGIWISDELTPYRDRLAYLARQAVKQNKALQSWTNEGKVFLKVDNVDRPIKITKPEDLP